MTRPLVAALALATALAGCGAGPKPPERPDLVLVSVDTLRADHLGSYGHAPDVSPTLDRVAAQGVRFEEALVQWPTTWPSMASMLTGTYPGRNGVVWEPKRALDWSQDTLAEVLSRAGYRTGAVVSNAAVGRRMQFQQGFDHFVESWNDGSVGRKLSGREVRDDVQRRTNATRVTDLALQWLGQQSASDPVFLWVHYMDPHGPYTAPDRYRDLYADAYPEQVIPLEQIPVHQRLTPAGADAPTNDLAYYRASYDREIRYFDDEFARLLAALERRWGNAPGLLAVTADHGESFDEHGEILGHGRYPFRPTTRVPLLLRMPGRLPERRVVAEPVGLVDLMPSLLELLGVPTPEPVQGVSLVPAIDDDAPTERDVFGHAGIKQPPQHFVRRGPLVLMRFQNPKEVRRFGRHALYHVGRDPEESRNRLDEYPREAELLRQALDDFLEHSWDPPGAGREVQFDPLEREMLHQLGYGR